jgi:hypothetical protein
MLAADLAGMVVGIGLSVMVLSYLVGDNPAFRVAVHLFVGVSAGLAGAVVLRNVILPHLLLPLLDLGNLNDWAWSLVPFVLGVLLMTKLSPRFQKLGNVPMAYLVGVGAALAVAGGAAGTIFPLVQASIHLFDLGALAGGTPYDGLIGLINRLIAIVGTLAALAYFHFGARSAPNAPAARNRFIEAFAQVGMVFIASTFGVIFAGVFSAALTALIERIHFVWQFIQTLMSIS